MNFLSALYASFALFVVKNKIAAKNTNGFAL